MFYLSQMLGKPVVDASGDEIGLINDVAIETGEIFPRVTSLAFVGPDKTPFMLSWRKYVETVGDDRIALNVARPDLRFSYLQPDELLLSRDLLNKQIVDTQGKKVVRVNDLKLSEARGHLRLLGAEVGVRGILRGISPLLETAVQASFRLVGQELHERLIAWNYMDLLERDLAQVQLSVTHKRLHELHPADVADVLEQLNPTQRSKVFEHLDNVQAAEAIAELEDEYQAAVLDEFSAQRASDILEIMDPDDAADIIGDLPYETAERLLRLMGVKEARLVRSLLGYREESAGGIMTSEITAVTEDMDVSRVIDYLRHEAPTGEDVYYIYVVDQDRTLTGVISLRDLVVSEPGVSVSDIAKREVITVGVEDDQEDVADVMRKYDLLAAPVVDETGKILGVVTVDDALEVMEEESAEDLALATGSSRRITATGAWSWLARTSGWVTVWVVLGVGAALLLRSFSDPIAAILPAVFFLPLVVRLAEDISSHALSVLFDAPDTPERPPLVRRVLADLGVGAALAFVSGLIVFGVLEAFGEPLQTAWALSWGTTLAILAATVASSLVPAVAGAFGGARRIPSTLLTTLTAVLAVAVYLSVAAFVFEGTRLW
jgi:Mg2+ transporter MgtE